MRALIITLCLIATPALADMAGNPTVIDGDTLEIHGQRIRFHGIDAPESRQLCRLDGKPWQCGRDAANALADKIARHPSTSARPVVTVPVWRASAEKASAVGPVKSPHKASNFVPSSASRVSRFLVTL